MSVLVYIENVEGKFRKSAFEAVSYAYAVASKVGGSVTVLPIGKVPDNELIRLGHNGAPKVLSVVNEKPKEMNVQPYASVIAQAAKAEGAKVVIMSAGYSGKGIAPRVAVKLNASLGDNVIDLPDTANGFEVKKNAFSGKAYSYVELLSEVK